MGKAVKQGTERKRAEVESLEVESQNVADRAAYKLDEATFQHILEAAYVLQQQNDLRRPAPRQFDPAATLAQIAETQELLRSQQFDLKAAARLIAERLGKITNATGIAIAVIRGDQLEYCAAGGTDLRLEGSSGAIGSNLSAFLREEESLQRFQSSAQWSREMLESRNPDYPLLFPIYHEGRIAGLLQLSFAEAESIQEHEIRSCQVMAGLMGEAIARATELEWKQALAAERATMLEALERLRPQLERLVDPGASTTSSDVAEEPALPEIPALREANKLSEEAADLDIRESPSCKQCGNQFGEGEMFCGRCGTPRTLDFAEWPEPAPQTAEQMQWDFHLGPELSAPAEPGTTLAAQHEQTPSLAAHGPLPAEEPSFSSIEENPVPIVDGTSALTIREVEPEAEQPSEPAEEAEAKPELVVVPQPEPLAPAPFGSAVGALKWLRGLEQANSPSRQWLQTHRGDIAIATATLVLIVALSGWGSHPLQSQAKFPPQPKLTLFERMLVGLGLAEPPAVPAYSGNPNIQVWEDVHHALYYCPGSELYGKTPDGKFTTQGDAQLDQFQPAARKNCE